MLTGDTVTKDCGSSIGEIVFDSDVPDCEGTEKKGVECFVIGDAFFNEDTNSGVVGSSDMSSSLNDKQYPVPPPTPSNTLCQSFIRQPAFMVNNDPSNLESSHC